MKVHIENIWVMVALRTAINTTPLEEIEWYENGEKIEINKKNIDEFVFTGLSNIDFIQTGSHKKPEGPEETQPMSKKENKIRQKIRTMKGAIDKKANRKKANEDTNHFHEYSKREYKCSLGDDSGWCDGENPSQCTFYLDNENGKGACEIAL